MKHRYNIITKFAYNDNNYYISVVDDKNIIYYKANELNRMINLDKKDIDICNTVFESIKVDSHSVKIGIKYLNTFAFKIYYNIKNDLFFWKKLDNSSREVSSLEIENLYFNILYNDVSPEFLEILDSNNNSLTNKPEINDKNRFYTRFLKIGKKIIPILVSSAICLSTISSFSNVYAYEEKNEVNNNSYSMTADYSNDSISSDSEFDFSKIENVIDQNPRLHSDEKAYLKNFKFLFEENYEYMDIDLIKERLSTLQINYINSDSKNKYAIANYNIKKNVISVYNTQDFFYCNLTYLTHEMLHVFQDCSPNNIIKELSNELASREVLRRMDEKGLLINKESIKNELGDYSFYGKGYTFTMQNEYLLANILPKEILKKYQFSPHIKYITDYLIQIDNSSNTDSEKEERAFQLINDMNSMKEVDEENHTTLIYTSALYEKIFNQINYYYKILNNKDMAESLIDTINCYDYYSFNVLGDSGFLPNDAINYGKDTMERLCNYNEKNSDYYVYVIPRSYLCDDHSFPLVQMSNGPSNLEIGSIADSTYKVLYDRNIGKNTYENNEEDVR